MDIQRTIRSSSESSTVAFKIGMGHFHSQESGGCSYTAICRLLHHYKPYFLDGGPLEYVWLAAEKAVPLLLVVLIYRVDGLAILLEFL